MEKTQILDDLKEIIASYMPDQKLLSNLSDESDLINDLKINSAHIVDIVLDIEDKYNIMIEDDAITKMITVESAVQIIMGKINN